MRQDPSPYLPGPLTPLVVLGARRALGAESELHDVARGQGCDIVGEHWFDPSAFKPADIRATRISGDFVMDDRVTAVPEIAAAIADAARRAASLWVPAPADLAELANLRWVALAAMRYDVAVLERRGIVEWQRGSGNTLEHCAAVADISVLARLDRAVLTRAGDASLAAGMARLLAEPIAPS